MEQVIVALVGLTLTVAGLTLTVMIHLDRSRRQETDKLRAAMTEGFTRLRGEIHALRGDVTAGDDKLRAEMTAGDDKLRAEMQAGFAAQTAALIDLSQSVGRVEGRTETLVPGE